MCDVLDVSKSTYYKSLDKTLSNRDRENIKLTNKIIEIYEASYKRYGAPKIHYLLKKAGYSIGLNRVQRLMKQADIRSITVKKFRPTPFKERVAECEKILERDRTNLSFRPRYAI